MRVKIGAFTVTHDGASIVTVRKDSIKPEVFQAEVLEARLIASRFERSKPGSMWGCDGVGYEVQKNLGVVEIKNSGVGPRKFRQGVALLVKEYA